MELLELVELKIYSPHGALSFRSLTLGTLVMISKAWRFADRMQLTAEQMYTRDRFAHPENIGCVDRLLKHGQASSKLSSSS